MNLLKTAILLLTVLSMPAYVAACDAAGENTHVGQLLSANENQFTIRDAQTGKPIQFSRHQTTQKVLPIAGSYVSVQYSKDQNGFVAESIR